MALPVHTVQLPLGSDGKTLKNGKLGPCDLTAVYMAGQGHVSLHPVAARAWEVLATMCHLETGAALTVVSLADAYRSYESQERLFRKRYTTTVLAGRPYKTWNGQRWYQLPNVALAATPGTSNHGFGLAIDAGWYVPGKPTQGITSNKAGWAWLQAHAIEYGFSWEAQSEPWHIRHHLARLSPQAQAVSDFLQAAA